MLKLHFFPAIIIKHFLFFLSLFLLVYYGLSTVARVDECAVSWRGRSDLPARPPGHQPEEVVNISEQRSVPFHLTCDRVHVRFVLRKEADFNQLNA